MTKKMDKRTVREAKEILTDFAFDETQVSYPVEFEAVRTGVQALSIVEKIPDAIEAIAKRYRDMIDGKKNLSIAEYNAFVLKQLTDLYE